jgi:hypothetical protein
LHVSHEERVGRPGKATAGEPLSKNFRRRVKEVHRASSADCRRSVTVIFAFFARPESEIKNHVDSESK